MKKLILGIIIGMLLAMAVPAAAEEIAKKVTATVRADFLIEVDGKEVTLKNSPLAYDGNSYLPVRELALLLGKDVDFKDGVIKLDTPIAETSITSKKEFDDAIKKLEGTIESNEKLIAGNEVAIKQMEDQLKDRPDKLQEVLGVIEEGNARYEAAIVESKKAISDLKAKYPQYAN